MNLDKHLEELDEQGYTLLPGLIGRDTTAAIREFIDRALADILAQQSEMDSPKLIHRICHPIEDPIIVRLTCDPVILDLAARGLRAENLRIRQQMFMLTLPCGQPPPARPDGWHIDTPFQQEEWDATPRKSYLQFFCYCNPVRSGGSATMVIPGSHRRTYAALAAANCRTEEEKWAFTREIVKQSGADELQGVEICCEEGDVALFQPMLLHSGSNNISDTPRYAFHCSFHDASAERVRRLSPVFYDTFPQSMQDAMPEALLPLLER